LPTRFAAAQQDAADTPYKGPWEILDGGTNTGLSRGRRLTRSANRDRRRLVSTGKEEAQEMTKRLSLAALLALAVSLALPGLASAQEGAALLEAKALELDMTWVAIATVLVFLMQAGFMFLEIGFSRRKNAGTGVAKIFVNLAIITIAWWAIGYGISGPGNDIFGTSGFFFHFDQAIGSGEEAFNVAAPDAMLMLFGLAFAAVSLAIVWGTTLERIKFGAYVIYAAVFGALIYPLVAHGVWGGGLLADVGGTPVMDFAGSSVVHLTGAVGGLAALLLLGARKGKYGPDGKPRAIPGHSMPLVGLGVIILWIGWFGFNGGSTFETAGSFFGEVMLNTQLAAAAGVLGASAVVYAKTKSLDVGMAGNGAIAGLVGITAGAGFVEYWAAPIIGLIAGVIVVYGVLTIEKFLDDPVGALSAHGLAGIWGTLAVGVFGSPRLVLVDDGAAAGIWYGLFDSDVSFGPALGQLGVQTLAVVATFVLVFVLSYATFAIIKATIGLRVPEEEELAGLDISSHGMYGYPEAFIPQEEYPVGRYEPRVAGTPVATPVATATQNA
jgi:ammonium transporter, Amt family